LWASTYMSLLTVKISTRKSDSITRHTLRSNLMAASIKMYVRFWG
jgi:hypothetical protein